MTFMVSLPVELVRSTPPSARQWTRTPSSASLATVEPTSITLRPRRSSLVTTSTLPASRRSEVGEAAALRGGDIPRHCLGDDAPGLDLKAGRLDLLQLVSCCLASGRDAKVGEGARHGQIPSEKAARNLPPVQRPVKLVSGQVK